jgi:multisubunit Na+/H+ antiporter MnhG subunit
VKVVVIAGSIVTLGASLLLLLSAFDAIRIPDVYVKLSTFVIGLAVVGAAVLSVRRRAAG